MRRRTIIGIAAGAVVVTAGAAVIAVGVGTTDHGPPDAAPAATSTPLPSDPSGASENPSAQLRQR